ncbi:MAG: hypothetical protein LBB61_09540, partial [Treponema sp.]|nr:hypothetical protein [Treponema sp.]
AVTAGNRMPAAFRPPRGNAPDAGEGRAPPKTIGIRKHTGALLMERAYEDGQTRRTARELGYTSG